MKNKFIILSLIFSFRIGLAQWSVFANGNTNGTVVDFEIFNNDLYAAGLFTQINGSSANYFAKWNGSSWQQVAGGFSDPVHTVKYIDSTLFVARYEYQVDSNWVYYLSNNTWKKLGNGFYLSGANAGNFYTCSLYDVIKFNGDLYVCGEFTHVGTQPANGIARWNGSSWQPVGTGLDTPFSGQVIYPHKMITYNNKLYVCGNFKKAGGQIVNGIASWDGTSWSPVGTGFNSVVYAIGVYNNQLYAGGDFTGPSTNLYPLDAIAVWNGTNWLSPGFGFNYTLTSMYNFVHSIEPINNKLYISGGFNRCVTTGTASTTYTVGSIIEYDGTSINNLAMGANNDVEAIIWWQNKLTIGGFFSSVGNGTGLVLASKLARYDTSSVTSVINLEDKLKLELFPNPVDDKLFIRLGEQSKVNIYNVVGEKMFVREQTETSEMISIDFFGVSIRTLFC